MDMSAKIMGLVWDLELSPGERIVLLAMADHADHEGNNVRPSIPLIAWKTDYGERQIKRIIKNLRDAGILILTQGATPRSPNHYRINLAAGKPKKPFRDQGGQVDTPSQNRGDILTPLNASNVTPGVTQLRHPRGDIAMSPKPSIEPSYNHHESVRAKRATPAPKQASMNSLSEPVQIYKELTGQKTLAPVVADRIADTVIDLPHWREVITVWCGRYDKRNTDGMLDWYLHPDKMTARNGHRNGTTRTSRNGSHTSSAERTVSREADLDRDL